MQALTRGARDYVVKQRLQRLPDAIRRARQESHERNQLLHAQAALNESQAQLQQVTDAVPALIAQLDNAHRYRFANKAFLDWHGFSLAELLGRTAREVSGIPPSNTPCRAWNGYCRASAPASRSNWCTAAANHDSCRWTAYRSMRPTAAWPATSAWVATSRS